MTYPVIFRLRDDIVDPLIRVRLAQAGPSRNDLAEIGPVSRIDVVAAAKARRQQPQISPRLSASGC